MEQTTCADPAPVVIASDGLPLVTLMDIAKTGYWVLLKCPCGHEVRHNPMVVVEKLAHRGADLRLSHLHQILKCGSCGGKVFTASHCEGREIWSDSGKPVDHAPPGR